MNSTSYNNFYIQKIHEDSQIPKKGSQYSAGYDLHSYETLTIPAGQQKLVPTGIKIGFSQKLAGLIYARIAPRSGLALKNEIDVFAGVVDYDYNKEVFVLLRNFGKNDFVITKGDRIAQLIIERL